MKKFLFIFFALTVFVFGTKGFGAKAAPLSIPNFNFINPTPADSAWINDNSPWIKVEADTALSRADLFLGLPNGGFESGTLAGFRTDASLGWFATSSSAKEGTFSARSGKIGHSSASTLSRTITLGSAGTLSFWWSVSSEANFDFLRFYINDVEVAEIYGILPWHKKSFSLTAGVHELKWIYSKDGSIDTGADTAWVDDIRINDNFGYKTKVVIGASLSLASSIKKLPKRALSASLSLASSIEKILRKIKIIDVSLSLSSSIKKFFKITLNASLSLGQSVKKFFKRIVNVAISLLSEKGGKYIKVINTSLSLSMEVMHKRIKPIDISLILSAETTIDHRRFIKGKKPDGSMGSFTANGSMGSFTANGY